MSHEESHKFWRRADAREVAALVDGEHYFRAFYHAAQAAERYILIAGWQFDLETNLLRGPEAELAKQPVPLWSLLRRLCEREPQLHIYVLAWDYSIVYALERQWLQSFRARWNGHPRMRLEYREHPDVIGAHHQKFVVIDDKIAFSGGIDFSESRWDTRGHRLRDDRRRNRLGAPAKPYHELHAALTGPVVSDFTELFQQAWREGTGESLELPRLNGSTRPPVPLAAQLQTEHVPLPVDGLVLCRTLPESTRSRAVCEVQETYGQLIRSAEQLIYVETQYFTSSFIERVLLERLTEPNRPPLSIVVVMPNGAESPKEHFVLGRDQDHLLSSLRAAAKHHGHELRILCVSTREGSERVTCFIHSKIMIVDDRAMTMGSANLTNRSMSFDSELNLTWNLERPEQPVPSLRELRASLLAEHAGTSNTERFANPETLIRELDAEIARPGSKLHHLPSNGKPEIDPLWTAVFDPSLELWTKYRHELRAFHHETSDRSPALRLLWTVQLAWRLTLAYWRTRRVKPDTSGVEGPPISAREPISTRGEPGAEASESPRRLGFKFVLGLVILYALVATLGWAFGDSMQEIGRQFVTLFGLPGFALGTFLADGVHFPVPPQFYMLLTVALGGSAVGALVSITLGSLLGGAVGYFFARRLSHFRWISHRIERLRLGRTIGMMERHPYRWALIASLTPIAYSWLCYLAGFYRVSVRMFLLLCLMRVPKLLIYFAIIRAGWVKLSL